jgi:hypothetical protein
LPPDLAALQHLPGRGILRTGGGDALALRTAGEGRGTKDGWWTNDGWLAAIPLK